MTDNLALWNRHRTPHKDALKGFKKRGGFAGTAIDPMWSIRAATEEWGPMGEGWGYTVVVENMDKLSDEWVLHTVSIYLWYGSPQTLVPSTGSTWMVSPCKKWVDGVQVDSISYDDEAPKKSRTDALTKALSWLGFGADIYMGMHDGSKYADLQQDEPSPDTIEDTDWSMDVAEESERDNIKELDRRLNIVKLNIKTLNNIAGEEKHRVWHSRLLSNFFDGVDSINSLSADDLLRFADYQEIKIKEHKE